MKTKLKDLREDYDLTQKEIANVLKCTQRAYSHYELGDRELPLDYLVKLADFYKVTTDYILCRTKIKDDELESSK